MYRAYREHILNSYLGLTNCSCYDDSVQPGPAESRRDNDPDPGRARTPAGNDPRRREERPGGRGNERDAEPRNRDLDNRDRIESNREETAPEEGDGGNDMRREEGGTAEGDSNDRESGSHLIREPRLG